MLWLFTEQAAELCCEPGCRQLRGAVCLHTYTAAVHRSAPTVATHHQELLPLSGTIVVIWAVVGPYPHRFMRHCKLKLVVPLCAGTPHARGGGSV